MSMNMSHCRSGDNASHGNLLRRRGSHKLALILAMLLALVLQGMSQVNAMSFVHSHSQMQSGSGQAPVVNIAKNMSSEMTKIKCAHHQTDQNQVGMQEAVKEPIQEPSLMMECCGDDCKCSTEQCFNTTGLALVHPLIQPSVTIARTTAQDQLKGLCSRISFKQYRPPKSRLTV
ncbi:MULTISPECIES: hypothetical protein [unclassified Alteromonas]|uniref:hypothetical protein n=2 Tax=Alteromonas TaxID=226 RepID=UPI0019230C32|nr:MULTISPECIES: hypothetical protein [unclassified Alteromonas]